MLFDSVWFSCKCFTTSLFYLFIVKHSLNICSVDFVSLKGWCRLQVLNRSSLVFRDKACMQTPHHFVACVYVAVLCNIILCMDLCPQRAKAASIHTAILSCTGITTSRLAPAPDTTASHIVALFSYCNMQCYGVPICQTVTRTDWLFHTTCSTFTASSMDITIWCFLSLPVPLSGIDIVQVGLVTKFPVDGQYNTNK